ncbi:heterokaryon incompatibility protein-domain-containing protein [Lophiotrema nucula]|uniref:Heterokaryon incompatibility protein-domain-containing protein n=1 Tax=Lophiotrema nucula TaxID=690887 RepID=A0A6A5ZR58_9PLEO|nr:heterokaryon incompatibility protein-domain-containing protein [Lophiotrema nucula]
MAFHSRKLSALHRRIKSDNPKSTEKLLLPASHSDDLALSVPLPPTVLRPELCNICRDLDLVKVAIGDLRFTNFFLNPKEPACILCTIMQYMHSVSQARSQVSPSQRYAIRVYVGYQTLEIYYGLIQVALGQIRVSRMQPPDSTFYPDTLSTPLKATAIVEPSQVNMKLVGDCFSDCSSNHPDCKIFRHETLLVYLVDVVSRSIVRRPSDVRYLALSYVWGDVTSFNLTTSNIDALREPGSLLSYFSRIPEVVRDAMRFTDQLGFQYLWVDTLCIVQDSPAHRDPQISRMNVIYRNAFATIVALSGQDAGDRLPGVTLGSRTDFRPIKLRKGVELQPLPQDLELAMMLSRYETRAWTYQERLLSVRCLYFAHSQVYFHCRTSFCCENGDSVSNARRHLFNPLLEFETRPQVRMDYIWLDFFRCYDAVVRAYTRRSMSKQEDKLRAFAGIAAMFQDNGSGLFQYGLPEAILDLALLWIPAGPVTRLQSKVSGRVSENDYIPSWSWGGWDGPVRHLTHQEATDQLRPSSDFDLPDLKSEITSFKIHSEATSRAVRRSIGIPLRIISYPSETYDQSTASDSPITGSQLCFSTLAIGVGTFSLRTVREHMESLNTVEPGREHIKRTLLLEYRTFLCNSAGDAVGVFLDAKSNCDWGSHTAQFELILLSRLAKLPFSDAEFVEMLHQEHDDGDEWPILNVMLIRWTHKGRYAERIAIGMIVQPAWLAEEPTKKMIKLV